MPAEERARARPPVGFFALVAEVERHHGVCAACFVGAVPPRPLSGNIYTDGVHLRSLDAEDLHEFARSIGLRREWFQKKGERFRGRGPEVSSDHYDLTTVRAYHRARAAGAVYVHWKAFPALFRMS